jgi:hypothetical protein
MEAPSNENAALLKLLKTKSRTVTELFKVGSARRSARQAALEGLLAEGKVVRIEKKYFANDPNGSFDRLIDTEAARLDAYLRSLPELLSRSSRKLTRAVKDTALASLTLQRLIETGHVIEFKYQNQRLCLHSAHLPRQAVPVDHPQHVSPDLGREPRDQGRDLSVLEVRQAYDRVRGRQLGSAVFISDLATELQIGVPKLHEWIRTEVIQSGHGSLDEGHWPTATDQQQSAAIEHLGSMRLLIRF